MQYFERASFEEHMQANADGTFTPRVLLGRISANLQAYQQPSTHGYIALGDGLIFNPDSLARWRVPCAPMSRGRPTACNSPAAV